MSQPKPMTGQDPKPAIQPDQPTQRAAQRPDPEHEPAPANPNAGVAPKAENVGAAPAQSSAPAPQPDPKVGTGRPGDAQPMRPADKPVEEKTTGV